MSSKIIAKTQFEDDYKSSDYAVKKFSKSRTDPSGATDLTTILRKHLSGQVVPTMRGTARYGDFSNIGTYQDAMEVVLKADNAFYELPSAVRKRFDNDPAKLLDFLQDNNNLDEAVKLGLIDKPVTPVVDNNIPQNTEVTK